jgi:hypothetical protein
MKRVYKIIFLVMIFYVQGISQIEDPMLYQRWNIFDINRVRTKFNNTGLLCDGNQQNIPLARPPAFEFPNGSGLSYGTAVGVVIGAPADQLPGAVGGSNPNNREYCDATLDEGPAAFWDEEHFAPYPEIVKGDKAPISTDPTTWPNWPTNIPGTNVPLKIGPEGWPGIGKNGSLIADQETYSVMYAWKGTDLGDVDRYWLKTHMEMRGFAWTGQLYQDFIIWMFVIRNIGTDPIKDMRVGIHVDFGHFPIFLSNATWFDDDRHYYDPSLQLAYSSDHNFIEQNPKGGYLGEGQIAWAGVAALRMPGPSKKVQTYDAFHFWMDATTPRGNGARKDLYFKYNLMNIGDPDDSDGDGIDDDFDHDGVPDSLNNGPGYYLGLGADGLQVLGSGPFTLNPGESDTLIFATVFGMSKKELIKNTKNAWTLYRSGFNPVKAPPAPRVEVVPGDGKNTLLISLDSEKDPEFQGYKIYRSADDGQTWGSQTFTDFEGGIHYIPLFQFDKIDGIKGHYSSLPEFAWYYLGDDTGLPPIKIIDTDSLKYFKRGDTVRVVVDNNVINGLSYIYYVAAYDSGNGITGPLENTASSKPMNGTNTVRAIPYSPKSKGLIDVKVVPNPYVVANAFEQGTERQIQFTRLPEYATIRIYNVAGELIKTIYHSAENSITPTIAKWDLKNENQQLVAPGVYFYHIESPEGTAKGKFIIIL